MTLALFDTIVFSIIAVTILGRIAFLRRFRVRVLGTRVSHDYSRLQRNWDEDHRMLDTYKWSHNSLSPPPRDVIVRVSYSYRGVSYRKDVAIAIKRGGKPEKLISLWIDPKNPSIVSTHGPGYWFVWLLILFLVVASWKAGLMQILDGNFPFCEGPVCSQSSDLKPMTEELIKHRE